MLLKRKSFPLFLVLVLLGMASCATIPWGFYRTSMAVEDPRFIELLNGLTDGDLLGGNRVDILLNGDEIFPSMLAAIGKARKTIHMESYIFDGDHSGRIFAAALSERAGAGVTVRLIVDDLGDDMGARLKEELREAGVQLRIDNPWSWLHPWRGNFRTHRKLLIVDGSVGFTGGVGISDRWVGDADSPEHWRETHCRVEGPVVSQLQRLFLESWERAAGEALGDDGLFPAPEGVGEVMAAVVGESKEEGSSIREIFLLPLAASRRYYYMSSAYFVPDPDCMRALKEAVERGVDVRVIVSGEKTDLLSARLVASKNYGRLLLAGIRVYEYEGTNMHAKTVVSDGIFVTIGSANFNNRAFTYNYESNMVFYDEELAARMERIFFEDLKNSREVVYAAWRTRPMHRRFMEQAVGIIEGWM